MTTGLGGFVSTVLSALVLAHKRPAARSRRRSLRCCGPCSDGYAGKSATSSCRSLLTADDLEVNEDGTFVITVSIEPANGRPNHLQLTSGSKIIAARNTLGDWNTEEPMSLSIERVGGPPNSLFAQIGRFAFLGPQVASNPLLTTLVSLVPPLPYMSPVPRGVFTALILVVRGASQQSKYMALASTDPDTGMPRAANTVSPPAYLMTAHRL